MRFNLRSLCETFILCAHQFNANLLHLAFLAVSHSIARVPGGGKFLPLEPSILAFLLLACPPVARHLV